MGRLLCRAATKIGSASVLVVRLRDTEMTLIELEATDYELNLTLSITDPRTSSE